MKLRLSHTVDISTEDLAAELVEQSHEAVLDLVREIDLKAADWEFTLKLCDYFDVQRELYEKDRALETETGNASAGASSANIAVGTRVRWTSGSRGVESQKTGAVVRVLSPGEMPTRKEIREPGMGRDHVSYLVLADGEIRHHRLTGENYRAKGKLYWPRVAGLEVIP